MASAGIASASDRSVAGEDEESRSVPRSMRAVDCGAAALLEAAISSESGGRSLPKTSGPRVGSVSRSLHSYSGNGGMLGITTGSVVEAMSPRRAAEAMTTASIAPAAATDARASPASCASTG